MPASVNVPSTRAPRLRPEGGLPLEALRGDELVRAGNRASNDPLEALARPRGYADQPPPERVRPYVEPYDLDRGRIADRHGPDVLDRQPSLTKLAHACDVEAQNTVSKKGLGAIARDERGPVQALVALEQGRKPLGPDMGQPRAPLFGGDRVLGGPQDPTLAQGLFGDNAPFAPLRDKALVLRKPPAEARHGRGPVLDRNASEATLHVIERSKYLCGLWDRLS